MVKLGWTAKLNNRLLMIMRHNINTDSDNVPCERKFSHGMWLCGALSSAFYIFLLFRSYILDKLIPLEKSLVVLLPFTYLKYHHTLFRLMLFQLMAFGGVWILIKILKLTNKEIGWIKPVNITKLISITIAIGILYSVLVGIAGFYYWIIIDGMLLKKMADAHQLLWSWWLWPKYLQIHPGEIFKHLNIYAASLKLNNFILAPIAEEIIFRGILFAVLKKRMGIARVIVLTSLLDVFLHYNILDIIGFCSSFDYQRDIRLLSSLQRVFNLLPFSMVAGWLRFRYDNLCSPIVFHICYNFLVIIIWGNGVSLIP